MIGRLRGTLLEKQIPNLLVEIAGVAYEVQVPLNCLHCLPKIGDEIILYTHFVLREDGHFLYGFLDKNQRSMFRSLIRVNNVGPKLALAILSSMEPDVFARYVMENDATALTRIPGIGAKTAQRLVIEMRDRLDDFDIGGVGHSGEGVNTAFRDAISALIALGYKPHEAQKAIEKHQGKNLPSEELIRSALKEIK
jgi:holliday junction DNA helicase RuvA